MSPADCTACTVRPVADAAAPRVLFAHGGGSPFQVNFKYYFFKGVHLLQNTNPPIILHFPLHDAYMRLTSLFACFCCARRTQEYNAHCIATAAAAASALARASLACAARERRGAALALRVSDAALRASDAARCRPRHRRFLSHFFLPSPPSSPPPSSPPSPPPSPPRDAAAERARLRCRVPCGAWGGAACTDARAARRGSKGQHSG